METAGNKKKRSWRWLKISAGVIAGLIVLVVVVLQIALNSAFLTKVANRLAGQYVDGTMEFSSIKASAIRSFPNLSVCVKDFSLTYPHDRFSAYDSTGFSSSLNDSGRAEETDTLASFKKLELSLNYIAILTGKIKVHNAELEQARIFAHSYDSTAANWNMFKIESSEDDDTTSAFSLPRIAVRKMELTGKPYIVYTDAADTTFATLVTDGIKVRGRMSQKGIGIAGTHVKVDSLILRGRLPADSLAFSLDKFEIAGKGEHLNTEATARVFAAKLMVPLSLKGKISFPEKGFSHIAAKDIDFKAAMLELIGNAEVKLDGERTYLKADAKIDRCSVSDVLKFVGKGMMPSLLDYRTDAVIRMDAECDGWLDMKEGLYPKIDARISMPQSKISHKALKKSGSIAAEVTAKNGEDGKPVVSIERLSAKADGFGFDGTATLSEIFDGDPLLSLNAAADASLDTIMTFIPDSLGIQAHGDLTARIGGDIRASAMSLEGFSKANLEGLISSNGISFSDCRDSLEAYLGRTSIELEPGCDELGLDIALGKDIETIHAKIDSLNAVYCDYTFIRGKNLALIVQEKEATTSQEFGNESHPLIGQLTASSLGMRGRDSLFVGVKDTRNTFKISSHVYGKAIAPILSLTSKNSKMALRQGVNRYGLKDASIKMSAVMNSFEQNKKRNAFLDSLHRVYPGIPRDSLFSHMMKVRRSTMKVPDFMSDESFRKNDIDIRLDESLAKYVKDWKIDGGLDIGSGMIMTPYFPLKNQIAGAQGSFSNDEIRVSKLKVVSGNSDLSAKGALTGLKRALTGRGRLNLEIALTSDRLDANELFGAYNTGSKFSAQLAAAAMDDNLSDSQYMEAVAKASEAVDTSAASNLLVIPGNLVAKISLQANRIDYSDLDVNWLTADLAIKERCLQVTNTLATSNMGDIYFEGFYSTKTRQDLKTGFDLNMVDITADKVIQLFPAVDTLMPMLKAFKGNLDCEMAATSDLDTNMNLTTSTINGIMKINGTDLLVDDNDAIRKMTRLLMFRNRDSWKVNDMSVNGIIGNNKLEIFPFLLKIDRYTLAMSGIQDFDAGFKYHISVIHSPIPFRFGINLTGTTDNWKFRLGKAKYKSTDIPSFSAQIDTVQVNLLHSIHGIFEKGVDVAVKQNEAEKDNIENYKDKIGYSSEAPSDSLSADELSAIDSLQRGQETDSLDAALSAKIDAVPMEEAKEEAIYEDEVIDKRTSRKQAREAKKEERLSKKTEKNEQ